MRAPILPAAVIAATLALSLVAADADQRPGDAFTLGVLRRDGAIIPFAEYDGKRWSAPWPAPSLDTTVPITLTAVPKGWWGHGGPVDDWQVLTDAGRRAVHVTNPDWVDVHCVRQVVLRSDYIPARPAPPPSEQPYPKDGLAIGPPHAVEAIEILPLDSAEARMLGRPLVDAFNRAERDLDNYEGHPVSRRTRERIEPTIEAVYATGTGSRMYYVEAVREYHKAGKAGDDCAMAYGQGWFVRDAADVRSITLSLHLFGCERDGANYMLPLGALRVSDKLYWIAQFSGWDEEHFVVLALKPNKIDTTLRVSGGGCS